jgi:hypothetical protein
VLQVVLVALSILVAEVVLEQLHIQNLFQYLLVLDILYLLVLKDLLDQHHQLLQMDLMELLVFFIMGDQQHQEQT